MRTIAQTQWINNDSQWFKRTIDTAKVIANNTYIVGKVAVVAIATVAVSSVKVVTGAFGTSRFSKMTNNMAYNARQSAKEWMALGAAFEVGYLFMLSLILLLKGAGFVPVAIFAVTSFISAMLVIGITGVVSGLIIDVINSLYTSIKGGLNAKA